jgi:hypothetical protein
VRRRRAVSPTFLIIGAMRSGTTSLARSIGAHPDVFMAREKEIHYFDLNYPRGIDWYRSHFSNVHEHAVGEATQTYMYDEEARSRMASTLPDTRLIAILRNPVDRAYSHYWMNLALEREDLGFVEAIEREPERIVGSDARTRFRFSYLDRGRYVHQLRQVCERYPREQLLVLFFEEMVESPQRVYDAVCDFLGISEAAFPPTTERPLNRFSRFRSVRVRRLANALPRSIGRFVRRVNTVSDTYLPMDPAIRRDLEGVYSGENEALAEWLGRRLPWSGSSDSAHLAHEGQARQSIDGSSVQ